MSCDRVEPNLIPYHFGLSDADARLEIEEHLLGCNACLRALFDVKRAIETSDAGALPSRAARDRLRRAVADELYPPPKWSWWERPLAVAFAATAVLVAGAATRILTSGPGSPPYAMSERAGGGR